jgi:radical SAM superfamily enzyme YgiQ (UPF0313 family)
MPGKPNILAVYPERIGQRVFDRMPPLGMAWIAAVIRDAGYTVRLVDEQVERADIGALAAELEPALILIGGTSHSRFDAFDRATRAKAAHPPATIVYGGPHASFTAKSILTHISQIDIIAQGEGEFTTLDLIRWKEAGGDQRELSRVPGISYRDGSMVMSTGWRPFNHNLDQLPPPARDLLLIDRYEMTLEYLKLPLPALHLITARGCPFACSFCSASKMFGRTYAVRSPSLVVDEIEELVEKYGIRGIKIFDSTFTINRTHVLGFCDELERRGLVMPWECEVRVGTVDRKMLERMREAGCYYIDIGIESGDQTVLDDMHKGILLEDAEKLLHWCAELGIRAKAFFTVGHIGETYEAALKPLAFIRKTRQHISLIGYNPGIRVYPGTLVEEYARDQDLLPKDFEWSKHYENRDYLKIYRPVDNIPLLLQPEMSIAELRRLRQRYILSRLLSPGFILFKLRLLWKNRELGKYLKMGLKGLFKSGSAP